ncbi:hypothetical protein Tco_1568393 [Tanacetum coccineum]
MSGTQDENPPPPPPTPSTQQTPTQQTPHTVSTIKLPILKKGEYDIWAMKMEHYLAHTDYPIWERKVARERERKARTTLLMAIPEDHLAKFHKMTDAKEMWNAIKSRFGGNDESKKMQKYILKQQFEGFTVSNTDGIHKGYERFQSLLSQLEIHGAGVSTEDANQKFLRSLPSAWLQVSLIMRNKPGMDSLSFDDLYNNLRVFENDVKGSTASSSNLQNVAFISENTNSTNEVSTAYGVSNTSGHNSKLEQTSSYSLLAMAMISMRIKKFYKKTGRKLQFDAKEPVGFDKTKLQKRANFDDASVEIKAYTQGLKKVEAQLVAHQQAQKEKDDLEVIVDKWNHSSKNLGKIVNHHMSARDKFGLGYGDYRYSGNLSYENEVFQSVFKSNKGDFENPPLHKRIDKTCEMQAVPPPMTGNYLPSGPDIEIRYS